MDKYADWKLSATVHQAIVDRPVDWREVPWSGSVPFDGYNPIPNYTTWSGMEALIDALHARGFVTELISDDKGRWYARIADTRQSYKGRGPDAPRALIAAACKAYHVTIA